jgi:flagellar motor component MotA
MENSKYATIKEIVEYGLEEISNKQTITINLKDFMYVYKVLQEYMRFFHNPDHYQTIDNVKEFLGTISSGGGFEVLDNALYKKIKFSKEIDDMMVDGIFDNPLFPKYYNIEE